MASDLSTMKVPRPGSSKHLVRHHERLLKKHWPERAIDQAVAAGDVLTAGRLICGCAVAMIETDRVETVRSWLRALGEDAARRYPPLGVTAAWIWALTGDVPQALSSALAAERGSCEGDPPGGSASVAAGVAMIRAAMAPLGVEQMLADAQRAIELGPGNAPWHGSAVLILGNARLMNRDLSGAVAAFDQAVALTRRAHPTSAQTALAQLALIAAQHQDWPRAEQQAAESAELMRATGGRNRLASMLTEVAVAAAATYRADRPNARRALGAATHLYTEHVPVGFPWLAGQLAIALGRLELALGDVPAARSMAVVAREHVGRLLTEGILGEQLRLLEDLLAGLAHGDSRTEPLSMAELRVLELLPTHLRLGEIGDHLHLSRNTVKSHVTAIHRKLGCSTRAEAVRCARKLGLIEV